MNVAVWDWGEKKSKLGQAEIKHEQANLELSAAQRQLVKNLHAAYNEAQTAFAHLDTLRSAADLAAENLRLNISRYQTDQAISLEVVEAQNNLTQARNALDDGELLYRVAIANPSDLHRELLRKLRKRSIAEREPRSHNGDKRSAKMTKEEVSRSNEYRRSTPSSLLTATFHKDLRERVSGTSAV
jgi:Outer membrane efflux protein